MSRCLTATFSRVGGMEASFSEASAHPSFGFERVGGMVCSFTPVCEVYIDNGKLLSTEDWLYIITEDGKKIRVKVRGAEPVDPRRAILYDKDGKRVRDRHGKPIHITVKI